MSERMNEQIYQWTNQQIYRNTDTYLGNFINGCSHTFPSACHPLQLTHKHITCHQQHVTCLLPYLPQLHITCHPLHLPQLQIICHSLHLTTLHITCHLPHLPNAQHTNLLLKRCLCCHKLSSITELGNEHHYDRQCAHSLGPRSVLKQTKNCISVPTLFVAIS